MTFPSQEITVRPMSSDDLETVMAIAEGLATAPRWPRSAYEAAIDSQSSPGRVALVAELKAAGSLVGFVVAAVIGELAELESIAVAPSFQGQGLGTALLTGLIAQLRFEAVTQLELEVREGNLSARSLYRRAGFAEAGRRSGYYRDPVEDALLLSLVL